MRGLHLMPVVYRKHGKLQPCKAWFDSKRVCNTYSNSPGRILVGTIRVAFIDNSVMDSVANKLKLWAERALTAKGMSNAEIGLLFISSAHRGSSGADYHEDMGVNGAIDIAAPMTEAGQRAMQKASRLLIQDASLLLEMIHSTPYSDDNGFYVKNGQIVGYSYYGAATNNAHINHIHLATNESNGDRLVAKYPPVGAAPAPAPAPIPAPSPAPTPGVDLAGPVYGWDASNHDWTRGPMDLALAKADGIKFFTHKCSEGTTYKDPYYGQALERAKAANIPVLGAYHVLWPGSLDTARVEAKVFFDRVNAVTPWWRDVPWVWQGDFEKFAGMTRAPSPQECQAFMDELKRLAGGRGWFVAYAPKWQYGDTFNIGYDLWASNYSGSGDHLHYLAAYPGDHQAGWSAYSGRRPRILQYASDATIGSQGTCDANKFDGSLLDLLTLTGVTATSPNPIPESGDDDMWLDQSAGFAHDPGKTWRTVLQETYLATHSVLNDPDVGVAKRVQDIEETIDAVKAAVEGSGMTLDYGKLVEAMIQRMSGGTQ